MIIRGKKSSCLFNVYGIFWDRGKVCFYCFPKNGFGLSSYGEDEVDVIDNNIGNDFVYFDSGYGVSGIFHEKLIKDDLLDQLLEHDPEAYEKFSLCIGRVP